MYNKIASSLIIFIIRGMIYFILCVPSFAYGSISSISRGNRLFKKKKYNAALEKYNEALARNPNSALINFNIGCAYYKKGEYKKAIDNFNKASLTNDIFLEGNAYYNIADSKYRQAKTKERINPPQAVQLYRESLEYYKKAIDKNPKDKDAKFNHEFVERYLKEFLNKMKQHRKHEKTGRNNPAKHKTKQASAGGNNQLKKNKQKQLSMQNKLLQKKAQNTKKGEMPGSKNKKNSARPVSASSLEQSVKQTKSMTPEEAKILLDSLSDKEKYLILRKAPPSSGEVYQNW